MQPHYHRALGRRLLRKNTTLRELSQLLEPHLPRLATPASPATWQRRAQQSRKRLLENFFQGHPPGLLKTTPRVQWRGTIETGQGYRIRKLRYEGYPGMWVPALLYEPTQLRGRVPVVLNPNGHHAGGKAMDYKQARCINLAKRGMLALSTEFIGMGELRADAEHLRIGLLDVLGMAGIGVFYLLMKRGLDVLLLQRNADPSRVAMTGLSGGGWQTALLAALDERITAIVPVAGHSPLWQRKSCVADIGDLEQCPSDLCTVADYDVLTGMFAPRPTLLIYNHEDDCCFQTRRTRGSIYRPARAIYQLLGAGDKISFHDNIDPGTHNYERDNRRQLYRFLDQQFRLTTHDDDLPYELELLTESELNVGLPADNATLYSLALDRLQQIRRRRPRRGSSATAARARLRKILHLPAVGAVRAESVGKTRRGVAQMRLHLDHWTAPVTELAPSERSDGVEIVISDGGRAACGLAAAGGLSRAHRTLVVDLLGTGESHVSHQFHMVAASAGLRPLGLQLAQLMTIVKWTQRRYRTKKIHLRASGATMPVVALLAGAMQPASIASIELGGYMGSLDRLVDLPMSYAAHAPLFCFGLLAEFDLPDLLQLAKPVPVRDHQRGPLQM